MGLYDLALFGHSGDTQSSLEAQASIYEALGSDTQQRDRDSPVNNADKLKIPVLIAYGGNDERVVPQHAEEMLRAMDKAGVRHPAPIYEPYEAHGFMIPQHVCSLYTKMLAFFDQYIGPDAAKH